MTQPQPTTLRTIDGVSPERMPRHVAIIMDGNGRWASARNLERFEGHRAGVTAARRVIEHAARLGLDALTLYSFSQENWKRPASEVDALMGLLVEVLPGERNTLLDNNVRFRIIGSREGLSREVLGAMDEARDASAHCTGLQLNIALNYGSRQEIVAAAQALARQVQRGELDPSDITEQRFSQSLWTAGLPDPDLLIRTASEFRVSNYLLWQISYAEIWVTDLFWPDFHEDVMDQAIREYANRRRRFGALDSS